MKQDMLSLISLSRAFGKTRAVDRVTLDIPAGQFVGVIGPSGAGKSTLLRLANRLVQPTEGTIRFCATDVTALRGGRLREWRRDCAMIFQQFNLIDRLDVLTNVLVGRLASVSARYDQTYRCRGLMLRRPADPDHFVSVHEAFAILP